MTILCLSHLLRCPNPDTYDTLFVIASYGLYYRCSNFVRQSVFVDKIQEQSVVRVTITRKSQRTSRQAGSGRDGKALMMTIQLVIIDIEFVDMKKLHILCK